MASDLIGRSACPECGFANAHVKIKTDKDGAHPYRHCPDCGAQYFPRSKLQAENLRKLIRVEGSVAPSLKPVTKPAAAGVSEPVPPSQNYKVILGVKVPA